MKNKTMKLAAVLLALFSLSAHAEFAGKDMEILDKPSRKAKSVGSISMGTEVVINNKKGLWLEVTADGLTGWVRKLHISKVKKEANKEGGSLSAAASMGSGRSGSGNVVSSSGVRGLDADALASAEFNQEEFDKYLKLAVSKKTAKKFAKKAKLKKVKV